MKKLFILDLLYLKHFMQLFKAAMKSASLIVQPLPALIAFKNSIPVLYLVCVRTNRYNLSGEDCLKVLQ